MSRILIIGGSGFLGRTLAGRLLEAGHAVTVLSRHPDKAANRLNTETEVLRYPGRKELIPQQILLRVDAIVNLAGESLFGLRWTKSKKKRILESRIQPVRLLAESLRQAGRKIPVLIQASATGYYGYPDGLVACDEASPKGTGFLPDVCEQWEDEADTLRDHAGRIVLARFGILLGRGGFLKKIARSVLPGIGFLFGKGDFYFPHIHVEDAARAIMLALENDSMSGPVNIVTDQSVQFAEFYSQYCNCRSVRRVYKLPELLPRLLLGEMSELLLKGVCAEPKVLKESGFLFKYQNIKDILSDILT